MNRNLTDSELSQVCEVIAARMGLDFPVERWAILGRNLALAAREFGFQNMNGFIQWLLSSELNQDQIKILASHLTVSETYFLREPKVFTALTDFVLPELIKSKKKRKSKKQKEQEALAEEVRLALEEQTRRDLEEKKELQRDKRIKKKLEKLINPEEDSQEGTPD